MSWHIDEDTLARYASGRSGPAVAASAEAHLTSCSECRRRMAPAVDRARLDAIWDQVEARTTVAELPLFERVLVRLGVGEDTARLLAATPSLGTAWLTAVTVGVLFAAVAAGASSRGLVAFLTVAPMLPVAGVAAAYGRHADPAYELAVASPFSMLRLLLVRSVAVVGSTVALTALGGFLLADAGAYAAAWLLPALALSLVTLALSARVPPVWAATTVLGGWVAAVLLAWQATSSPLTAFGAAGQWTTGLVLLVAAVALAAQRHTFAFDTGRSA